MIGCMSDAPPAPPSREPARSERVFFDAILHPHRSLGPVGFRVLMAAVGVVSLGVGGVFLAHGAWPVFGFFGLDAVVLYLAFRANYRAARFYERVRLAGDDLTVRRVAERRPERSWRFHPFWLRVRMDDPPRHHSQLTLSSHGQTLVVGSFLAPEERLEVARALSRALDDWRRGPCAAAPAE